jgi:hypothetical protein
MFHYHLYRSGWGFMVLNATFNNISIITWWSVLLVEETTEDVADPNALIQYISLCLRRAVASFELLVLLYFYACFICLVVFNATFNYISAISWRSVFWVEETGGPGIK